jgi:Spy/CpxP family protein refolding chaperone
MKKTIIAIAMVLAAGMAFTTTNALARVNGPGHGMHGRQMMGGGQMMGGYYQQGNNTAYQQFLDQTRDLRTSLRADRAELQAIMAGTNPDPAKVRTLVESIAKKEIKLSDQAKANNVSFGRMGPRGGGYNCPAGYGRSW